MPSAQRIVALAVLIVTGLASGSRTLTAQMIRLRGTVVATAERVVEDGVVAIGGTKIASVSAASAAETMPSIDAVIFAGLIDLHNHLTWNVMPAWQPPRIFTNRYTWQDTPEYAIGLSGPYNALVSAGRGCDMNRFGEIKALINGATATVGSLGSANACIQGLVRNLDFASEIYGSKPNAEPYRNVVFPFEPADAAAEEAIRNVNPSGPPSGVRAVVMHLAEGTDSAAAREFRQARAHGFLKEGVSIIHGVALGADQMRELADRKVGFVWSPHSNFILYGRTADIQTAMAARMTVAIAPDWSPTGSAGMLEELQVAYRYLLATLGSAAVKESQIVQMATQNPAKLAAVDSQLGTLEAGKLADLVVMRRYGRSPHQSLLDGGAANVMLVMIAGAPVYGDPDLMKRLLPEAKFEPLTICGETKLLHIVDDPADPNSWTNVSRRLTDAMTPLGLSPAPLAACGLR